MRKYLLIVLFFSAILTNAQTDSTDTKCEAKFKYEFNNTIMSPLPITAVNFYDDSEENVIAWFWNFGDGETSSEQNPLHIYNRPVPAPNVKINPYREVVLTILTADSCKSSYTEIINIMQDIPITETKCKAAFKYYQAEYDSINETATIQFTNLSEGDSLNYLWQFDDGKTSDEKEPNVTFDADQREYKVCLTVTGADSCTDVFCDAVYLRIPTDTITEECYTGFKYKRNYDIQTFAPALVLDFYSWARPEAVEWNWDFGDGNTSTEENPTHIFNYPVIVDSILGDPNPFREVCLTVKTSSGCVASYCEIINVYMVDTITIPEFECKAAFKYYQTEYDSINETATINFTNLSEGDSLNYFWQFDDGKTSTEKEPNVTFDADQREYKVCLTVTGADNCTDVFCDAVFIRIPTDTVTEQCYTGFKYKRNYDIKTFAPALVLDFYSWARPEAIEWNWDFGDGNTSTEENPTHIFNYPVIVDSILADPNPFREVCLTVKTSSGCVAKYCEIINVYMVDSTKIEPASNYIMRYESSYPLNMSSCVGYVKAQVYLGDSVINASDYKWSHGVEGQEANGFCPTKTYTVKAKTPEGIIVSGIFIFNSDGTVTETPVNWWVSGQMENPVVQYNLSNTSYIVEWKLCDGTIVTADSIPLNLINCETDDSNLIIKDTLGNVIYSENISRKSIATFIHSIPSNLEITLFPNPVEDLLNIHFTGEMPEKLGIKIYSMTGRLLINRQVLKIDSGQDILIHVNSLKKGIYLYKIGSGNKIISIGKFAK